MLTEQEKFMKEAIRQAKKARALEEVPIGCVIVYEGKIIARGYNRRNTDKNTLSHAELNAIRKASKKLGDWRLEGCTMYVTLEPCQMCAGALVQSRIDEVVIGSMNPKAGCAGSVLNLLEVEGFNHQVKTTRGVLQEECSTMLSDFFRSGLEGVGSGCLVFFLAPGGYIRTLLRNIFHEFYAREEYYQSVCASYIEIFFATVLRRCGGQYTRYSWQTTSGGTAPMLAVLKYLQDNYRTTTLNETAALFHYDPSYLGKQIKAYTGKNYTALIRELRIEMAKRLLRSTDDPMGEIAELAGFDRLSHFSSTFRLATGSSPSEYRRRYSTFRCPEEP